MSKEAKHIGLLVKNLAPMHDLEYKVTFNLHENTFFQKLIPKEILEKIRVKPADYFKSLMFLDYFSRIIENDYSVCDNLENMSKALREEEKERGEDNGENGLSYLNMCTVVLEAGLWANEKQLDSGKKMSRGKELDEMKKRYAQEKRIDFNSPNARKTEPFYEGIGEMVCDQIGGKMKPFLENISSRAELGALVFADSVLACLNDKNYSAKIFGKLSNKDYFSASLDAFELLARESSISKIKSTIGK